MTFWPAKVQNLPVPGRSGHGWGEVRLGQGAGGKGLKGRDEWSAAESTPLPREREQCLLTDQLLLQVALLWAFQPLGAPAPGRPRP